MAVSSRVPRGALWATGGLLLVGGFVLLLVRSQALPAGPRPVIWDRESCAECRMAVSDPRFACQLQATDGRILDFDDPGCLFRFVEHDAPAIHALYFHAFDGDAWLDRAHVAFLPGPQSPMGYDLAAVAAGTPGALDYGQARLRALTPGGGHGGG
jgi:hypothetical protein